MKKHQKRKIYKVIGKAVKGVEQELASFWGKGLESKYFRLCKPLQEAK